MSQVGYHLGHETQASKVMYLDSRDGSSTSSSSSEFSYVFDDALVTRGDGGMLVSLLSATVPGWDARDEQEDATPLIRRRWPAD